MQRITVKQLIETLQKFDPDCEIWECSDIGFFPVTSLPEEGILEKYDIPTTDYAKDVGRKVIKFY